MEQKFYELSGDSEGLIWLAGFSDDLPEAYCKKHRLKLIRDRRRIGYLICPEDRNSFNLRFDLEHEDANLARQKIFDKPLSDLSLVRIDPEGYQVIAKETNRKNPNYWIESKLSNTSKGLQLMVQVGKRDELGEKVQIFVEPSAQRMDFDRGGKDIHPTGIFTKLTAEFKNSKNTISKKD